MLYYAKWILPANKYMSIINMFILMHMNRMGALDMNPMPPPSHADSPRHCERTPPPAAGAVDPDTHPKPTLPARTQAFMSW